MIGGRPGRSRIRGPGRRETARRFAARAVVLVVLAGSSVAFAVPLYWLLSAAFKRPGDLDVPPELVPTSITAENFAVVLRETAFVAYFTNSLLVSSATVILTIAIATPAGYALSRYPLRYERHLLVGLLFAQMIPILATIVPLYRLFSRLGLLDSLEAVVLADTVLVVPIAIWLIKGYFDTVPDGLEEAARVGGATRLRAFGIVVPLAKPAIAASALFAFVQSWNQFVIPLTFAASRENWTFPVGLFEFISRRGVVDWGLLGAASLVAMLPILILFVAFQEYFVAGLIGADSEGG